MGTTNNEQREEPVNFVSEAFVDVMDMIIPNGALDQLAEAVRSSRQTDALSIIAALKTLLEDRVVWVLEFGQEIEEVMKMGEEFDSIGPDSTLEDARERIRVGVAIQGVAR